MSRAVNVAAVYQIQTRIRSGPIDLGSVGGVQNQTEETRRQLEESLKTYRDLAKKEPETYRGLLTPNGPGEAMRLLDLVELTLDCLA